MPFAVVTGASSPTGKAISALLANTGYQLVLHSHVSPAPSIPGSTIITSDLSTEKGQADFCAQILAQNTPIDLLVHCAGVFDEVAFENVTRAQFKQALTLDFEAPFWITQSLLPLLKRAPEANIVFLLDAKHALGWKNHAHYLASKAALASLCKTLALELAPLIRVNGIAPGILGSERFINVIPLKTAGTYEEIADWVLFLTTKAPYTTGQVISVDGGRYVG